MNLKLLLLLCALVPGLSHAQGDRLVMKLYPHGPSESNGLTRECWIKDFTQLRQVCDPSLTVCFPEKGKANGQAVVVCPGGGYSALAIHHEGFMVADWLNSLGITAVVLKYRMPNGHHQIPLKDAQTALEIVRRHARKWHINSDRIGIMGFSAGGHLASTAATHFTSAANRPAFAVLVYPVVTMGQYTHKNSRKELLGENPSRELIISIRTKNRSHPTRLRCSSFSAKMTKRSILPTAFSSTKLPKPIMSLPNCISILPADTVGVSGIVSLTARNSVPYFPGGSKDRITDLQ